jgi:hypothetical protein
MGGMGGMYTHIYGLILQYTHIYPHLYVLCITEKYRYTVSSYALMVVLTCIDSLEMNVAAVLRMTRRVYA